MASKVNASPPLDDIAATWAARARAAYRAGSVDEAVRAARLAVAAWRMFGPVVKTKGRKPAVDDETVHMPKEVAKCAKLIERYEKEKADGNQEEGRC